MSGFLSSSLAKKYAMALSALFLMFFLLQHFIINFLSVVSPDAFNTASHFMGTNPLVQYALQPVLLAGVIFHFVMGFILELKNRNARSVKYYSNKGSANSSWMSRNMIYTGLAILAFMVLHFIDFWIPEIKYKYIDVLPEDPTRYIHELKHKFMVSWRVGVYVISFIFLALHLLHGFNSAFQSMGANNKYTAGLKKFGNIYAIGVPLGFIVIALFHFFNH